MGPNAFAGATLYQDPNPTTEPTFVPTFVPTEPTFAPTFVPTEGDAMSLLVRIYLV